MPDFTYFAVCRFRSNPTKSTSTCVIYQDKDNNIRESRYDSVNGWNTQPDSVVVSEDNVMENSPIAVATWNSGRERRVYFIDKASKVCERALSATSVDTHGVWKVGGTIRATAASNSQLAVACIPDESDLADAHPQVQLFYQSQDDTIRRITYRKRQNQWSNPTHLRNISVYNGTSLTVAVSSSPSGGSEIRLYCQDPDKMLMEVYMDTDSRLFSKTVQDSFELLPKASISAVNWDAGPRNSKNLQIRVFSISPDRDIIAMNYDQRNGGWDDDPVRIDTPSANGTTDNPVVEAVQGFDDNGNLCVEVFYHPLVMIGQFTALKMLPVSVGGAMDTSEMLQPPDIGVVAMNRASNPKELDGSRIAWGSVGAVQVWDALTGRLQTLEDRTSQGATVAFSPDGSKIASVSEEKNVRIWNTVTGEHLRTLEGHTSAVRSVAFSPYGSKIASGSDDRTVRIWNAVTGQHLRTLEGHSFSIHSVAFSPDGSKIASGSADYTVRIWDAVTGQHLRTLQSHTSFVRSVAFSPYGSKIASGAQDNTMRLWDAVTGEHLRTFEGHTSDVYSVAFSPFGTKIASGSADYTVRVWDAVTGQHLQTLQGHTRTVWGVAFSPYGKKIASGSSDSTVRIWDAVTGQHLQTLQSHTGGVGSVAFSLEGNIRI